MAYSIAITRRLSFLAIVVAISCNILIATGQTGDGGSEKAVVDELKQVFVQKQLARDINESSRNGSIPVPNVRESTFHLSYIPVFMIIIALIMLIGLYVYDVFSDIVDEGGVSNWTNDTISLHCSDTTSNQFRFLLAASLCFSVGLTWLLAWEYPNRVYNTVDQVWFAADLIAAIFFACIGVFPTLGDTTRHQHGKTMRDQKPEEEGCVSCSTVIRYRAVAPQDKLLCCGYRTFVNRNCSKWIHLITALYAMIELTVSNMVWSFWDEKMKPTDDHKYLFRVLSVATLTCLVTLFTLQGILQMCKVKNRRVKAYICLFSMGAELFTLLFAVVTTMMGVLHRDPDVLWIFSTCVGLKT